MERRRNSFQCTIILNRARTINNNNKILLITESEVKVRQLKHSKHNSESINTNSTITFHHTDNLNMIQ